MIGPVELLRRQYLQMLDHEQLTLPTIKMIKQPKVQAEIYDTIFREGCLPFPPPARYQLRVLKRLIKLLEMAVTDPEEDVCFPCVACAAFVAM